MKNSNYDLFSFSTLPLTDDDKRNPAFLVHELTTAQCITQTLLKFIDRFPDGICITDHASRIIFVNRNWQILSETQRNEVLGNSGQQLVEKGLISASASAACIREKRSITIDQVMVRSGKPVLLTCHPIFDESQNVQFVVGSIRDISELTQLKQEANKNIQLISGYQRALEVLRSRHLVASQMGLVAESTEMTDALMLAQRAAKLPVPVLITGETGVGKEVVAQYIHDHSPRANKSFIKVNCAAIPATLFESELFGYEAGSFTGSKASGNPGLFETADQGTILLDEFGELPLDVQVKLLRVLQEGVVTRIGGRKPIKLNVRIICATNRNLEEMVRESTFRQDLFFRINVIPIHIPALRQRRADIVPLTQHFCKVANESYGFNKAFSSAALNVLLSYGWPGNIRELRNVVERSIILSDQNMIMDDTVQNILYGSLVRVAENQPFNLKRHLAQVELNYLNSNYYKFGTIREAAAAVGMSSSTFQRRRSELLGKTTEPQSFGASLDRH